MRIFVGGSLRDVADVDNFRKFVKALGRTIVERGHVLLNGCRNPVDEDIAAGATQWLVENKRDPKRYVISYWQRDIQPVHKYGTVRASALPDWKMSRPELQVPEQIEKADVAIFLGGGEGTYLARNWAHWERKLILGVPRFGGAGEQIYLQELGRLRDRAKRELYEQLNQITSEASDYAKEVVLLSEQLLLPSKVFVIMSYKVEWEDVFNTYKEVCELHGFTADRTDKTLSQERINPRIESGIANSAFVIADVTEASPNVYFEFGFAQGRKKKVILTAKKGTVLPFDINDVPVLYWLNQVELKEGLSKAIDALKSSLQPREHDL